MTNTKLDTNNEELEQKSLEIFKALSDPVRIRIIKYLKEINCEMACGEIGKAINISKSSGTYHFKLLEKAGLIKTRREAREKFVKLDMDTFNEYVSNFIQNL